MASSIKAISGSHVILSTVEEHEGKLTTAHSYYRMLFLVVRRGEWERWLDFVKGWADGEFDQIGFCHNGEDTIFCVLWDCGEDGHGRIGVDIESASLFDEFCYQCEQQPNDIATFSATAFRSSHEQLFRELVEEKMEIPCFC